MDTPLLRKRGQEKYGIPSNVKLVLCRHGGSSTFNIDFVRESISSLIDTNPGVHIILLNTDRYEPCFVLTYFGHVAFARRIQPPPRLTVPNIYPLLFFARDSVFHADTHESTNLMEFPLWRERQFFSQRAMPCYMRVQMEKHLVWQLLSFPSETNQ